MRHLGLPVAAALALVAAQPAAAQGSDTLKKIKDSGAITLGHRDTSIPFSYYDDKQQVVGYAMDICMRIVDAVKADLKLPKIEVKLNPVTSATRIPLMANGTIDLECGSTTNNLERQKQVAFTITHFVTANRYVAKKASKIERLADLKGKTVVSTSGTTNLKWATEENQKQNLGMKSWPPRTTARPFSWWRPGAPRRSSWTNPALQPGGEFQEPRRVGHRRRGLHRRAIRHHAAARGSRLQEGRRQAVTQIYKSGQIMPIYEKWFLRPVPPKGINLDVPMSAAFKSVVANPTDSGDPAAYQ